MRKIDYALLAQMVRAEIAKGGVAAQTAARIARALATRAHVDGPAFLTACGLMP